MNVTITVSAPYVAIAGGWSGLQPVGCKRDYTATVDGTDIKNTSKSEIQRVIRTKLYRSGYRGRISFTFIEKSSE